MASGAGKKVRDAMAAARPVAPNDADTDRDEHGGVSDAPPVDHDPRDDGGREVAQGGLDRLTPEQWTLLESCAPLDENDTDNGKRLLTWFGDELLHVSEAGWHFWTGTHWQGESAGQLAVERAAQKLVPFIKREAALLTASADEQDAIKRAADLRKEWPEVRERSEWVKAEIKAGDTMAKAVSARRAGRFQFAVRSGDRGRCLAMIAQAAPFRSVNPDEMDADDYALNCQNGTLRFRRVLDDECPDPDVERISRVEVELHPHSQADLISKVAGCPFDPKAKPVRWLADFERFMPDAGNREFLQVFMGYTALGLSGEQVYAFNYGDGGNWKSAFLRSVGDTLGTYCLPLHFSSISGGGMPSGDKPSPDWARLSGVRMLAVEEVPRREPIKEEIIKLMTSGSKMPVRHLNKGLFDLVPKFTASMASNAEPNISGGDHGIWRRTLVVHWEVEIPNAERIAFDRVMEMYRPEWPGILNWIIEGAVKYLTNGLTPYITDRMRDYTNTIRRDRDPFSAFCEDVLEHRPGVHIPARYLYQTFERWCANNGVDPVPTETRFGTQIKRVIITDRSEAPEIDAQTGKPVSRSMGDRKASPGGVRQYRDLFVANPPPVVSSDDTPAPPSEGPF